MTPIVGLALLSAVVDWFAVWRGRPDIETVAKPLVLALLVAAVVASTPTMVGWLVVAGLTGSLIGDVFLLPRVDRFISGLAAFLIAHLLFIAAFVSSIQLETRIHVIGLLLGAGVAAVTWLTVGREIIAASRSHEPPVPGAVLVYVVVLGVMLASGLAVQSPLAAVGVVLFAGSDAVLGWHRFVAELANGRLVTHVLYHLGQSLLALWAINLG